MRRIRISSSQASVCSSVPKIQGARTLTYSLFAVTPGITAEEYHARRVALSTQMVPNSAVILPAAVVKYKSGPAFYPFRQESNFLYLTGFSEPDSLAVLRKTGPEPEDFVFSLLVRPKEPQKEQWIGPWSGVRAALDVFNADHAEDIGNGPEAVPHLLRGVTTLYETGVKPAERWYMPQASDLPAQTLPLAPLIHPLRARKSLAEKAAMRRAGQVSGRALTAAMARPWETERQLHSWLDYTFATTGCDGPAYVPVVAGGRRGRMIHYTLNNARLDPGETVLVDAGGEWGAYITDITRTWPLSGRFSPAQRDLYEAVLRVQRTSVALCRADAGLSLERIHGITEEGLRRELGKIGFDMGRADAVGVLFPHHVGHYIGLDVHDTPGHPRHAPLERGHCVTVEPGVYVPDDERWPRHFRGLAVRIEDSVFVDEEAPFVFTTEAVKEVVDIEALRT
jgi:intermediate cleaving peptidase 55